MEHETRHCPTLERQLGMKYGELRVSILDIGVMQAATSVNCQGIYVHRTPTENGVRVKM